MKYNIMDAATLRVFDLNHAPKSGMKAADCDEHRQAAGADAMSEAVAIRHRSGLWRALLRL